MDESGSEPLIPVCANDPALTSESNGTKHDSDRDMVRLTRAMVWWTAALFFGAFFAALIAYFQLQSMRGQLHEMESSSSDTHTLATATQRLANEAKQETEAFDKLRKAGEAQASAANIQARTMDKLLKANERQAEETERLAMATREQASSSHELVKLTGQLAQAAADQSKASQTMANLESERSQPRFEIATTIEPTEIHDKQEFFPPAFKIVPKSGVESIDVAVAHEGILIHDGFTLCRVVLDNYFVWNKNTWDFTTSDAANILRRTAQRASLDKDGFSLQHLWVDISVNYETLGGKSERQLLRYALGRARPLARIPDAMEDNVPHIVLFAGDSGKRAVLGFETSKQLSAPCAKASRDLDRYQTIAITTAYALVNGEKVPIGEVKDYDPPTVWVDDPKAKPH